MTPLVSAIIPTYGREKSLKNAIASVLSQEGISLEVLVCEDGETESVASVVQSFHDPRVIHLPGTHVGRPAIPRNRGIAAAKGEWLAFLDDDDEWLSGKLCKQLAVVKDTGCLAICSNAYRKLANGNIVGLYLPDDVLPKRITFHHLLHGNFVINSSALVHASLVPQIGYIPESRELISIEDYAYWLRVAARTDFAVSSEGLLNYNDDAQASIRKYANQSQLELVLRDYVHWCVLHKMYYKLFFTVKKMCRMYFDRIKNRLFF